MSDPTAPNESNSDVNQRMDEANKLISDLTTLREELGNLIQAARDQINAAQTDLTATKDNLDAIKTANATVTTALEQIEKAKDTSIEKSLFIEQTAASTKGTSDKFDTLASQSQSQYDQFAEKQQLLTDQLKEIDDLLVAFNERRENLSRIASDVDQIRSNVEESASKATENSSSIAGIKTELENLKRDSETARTALQTEETGVKSRLENLNDAIKELEEKRAALNSLLSETETIKVAAETAKNSAVEDSAAVNQAKENFDSLSAQTQSAHDALITRHQQAADKITEIDGISDRIRAARLELLDDHDDNGTSVKSVVTRIKDQNNSVTNLLEETNKHVIQKKSEWDTLLSKSQSDWEGSIADFNNKLTQLVQQSKVQVDNLKADLTNEIRKLLPGAGAAGLSWAYYDAKTMYGPGKFDYGGDAKDHWFKKSISWIGFALQYRTARFMFYVLFLGPALLIAYYFYELMEFMLKHPTNFDPNLILFRTLISLPLATISFFGWSSIRLYRRLYEEYNHKQRVMQLYESFKKEMESAGTKEQREALLTIMLKTVGDKPTLAMHNYDKGFELPWPKFKASTELGLTPAESSEAS